MKGYEDKKFFDMEIYIEKGLGNVYRLDNFIPILCMKYLPWKFSKGGKGEWKENFGSLLEILVLLIF